MARVITLIIAVTLIWGYTWVTMKIALAEIPPFLFSALRLLIGAIPLFIVQWARKKPWLPSKGDWGNILVLGLLMSIGYLGLLTFGMQFVTSGKASVLVYTMPIITTLLAHFFLNERLTSLKIVGLFSGLIGLLFILGPQMLHLKADQSLIGQLLIILAAVCWSSSNIYTKARLSNSDSIMITSWQLLLGSIMLLAISVTTESFTGMTWSTPTVLSLIFNGVFSTAFTFVAWFWILGQIEASVASMALMAVPILGLFFGWVQLDEPLTSNILVGTLFICLGIFFGSYKRKKRPVDALGQSHSSKSV